MHLVQSLCNPVTLESVYSMELGHSDTVFSGS